MERRQLGSSDLEISRIGFGAWAAGGGSWAFSLGPQDDSETISAIRRAVELGINWIDTAPLYGLGHSEEVVAEALDGLRDVPFVFTKCGMPWDESGRIVHCLKRDSIRRECEGSLRRLRSDVIDLYQIHWNKPAEDVREAVETLAELQSEGKIRHIGVSNFNSQELDLASRIANVVCLQPPYSVIDRSIENDILPYCGENAIGVIIYSPMKSGLLSGKMTRERVEALPPDDLRRSKPEFNGEQLEQNLAIAEKLREIGSRRRRSTAEVAVAWTLQNRFVDAAIVGMRRIEHVNGIVGAVDLQLSTYELGEIDKCLSGSTVSPHHQRSQA
jgi:aryl-alcohol dehydrogenase-like predicted oxidoreductase